MSSARVEFNVKNSDESNAARSVLQLEVISQTYNRNYIVDNAIHRLIDTGVHLLPPGYLRTLR